MKESALYKNFFQRNGVFLVVPALLFGVVTCFYQLSQPVRYQQSGLFEFPYNQENISQQIARADEVVTILRSSQFQRSLNLETGTVTIFKPGPVSVQVSATSLDEKDALQQVYLIQDYLKQNYQVNQIGAITISEIFSPVFLPTLLAITLGLFIGLSFSLGKEYFNHF